MRKEEFCEIFGEISEKYIIEAQKKLPKKRMKIYFRMAVAAVLVIAVGIGLMNMPMMITANMVAEAASPRVTEQPNPDDYIDKAKYKQEAEAWRAQNRSREGTAMRAIGNLTSFFTDGNKEFLLTENEENKIWSPVNAYIGLAMLTELTKGNTRQQILDLFGVADTQTLRKDVSAIWESVYQDNAYGTCTLANSLWLENGLKYNQDTMDALAYHHYASVYQSDLGSDRTNKDIAAWINNNTDNFLNEQTKNIQLDADTIMALYSTIYFQAEWMNEFSKDENTTDVFHMKDRDIETVFMNQTKQQMNYYWGENCAAVRVPLKNGSSMYFILPDEGKSINDVLENETYIEMITSKFWENYKNVRVNLSVPKFDVASTMDLSNGLKNMGVTDAFLMEKAEFTNLTYDMPMALKAAKQSVRVEIDEKGVKAGAYVELATSGGAAPNDIVDFVLDRPFLFAIEKNNIPLFVGCVNNPVN